MPLPNFLGQHRGTHGPGKPRPLPQRNKECSGGLRRQERRPRRSSPRGGAQEGVAFLQKLKNFHSPSLGCGSFRLSKNLCFHEAKTGVLVVFWGTIANMMRKMEFSQLHFASFFKFMAAYLSLTHLVTAARPLWIAVKFQSNSEIAGSPRNSFRASVILDYRR